MTPRSVFVCVLGTLVWAGVADAHVTIRPREASAKSSEEYVVRVPTERDVPTVSVRMQFPPEFVVVRFKPAPGWTYETERDSAGKIIGVTWSGNKIGREEYQEFAFLARAPERPGPLTLLAYQTYEGGEVVGWVDAAGPRPAPKVTVVAASAAVPSSDAPATASRNPPGRGVFGMSLAALVLSIAAFVVSVRDARRRSS